MQEKIPENLKNHINNPVLNYIENRSAHSDIAHAFMESLKQLGDVQIFCPDWKHFRYVFCSTKDIIFGVAIGMDTIGFRVGDVFQNRAIKTGNSNFPELGSDWAKFIPHKNDWPEIDLKFWALKAYVFTRE
jgi:hypothetical protein